MSTIKRWNGSSWEYLCGSGSKTEWGSIEGSLADQSDLQAALNAKIEHIKTINNETLIGTGNIDINSAVWGSITGNIADQSDLNSSFQEIIAQSSVAPDNPEEGDLWLDTEGQGGGTVWGSITGNIADQSDLQDAFTAKQDKSPIIALASPTEVTLADNTEYALSDVASLNFSYPSGTYSSWIRMTTVAEGTVAISFPSSKYAPSAPVFGNGETWLIGVDNGIVVAQKAVDAT